MEYIGPRQQRTGTLPRVNLDLSNDEFVRDQINFRALRRDYPDVLPAELLVYSLEEIFVEKFRSLLYQRTHHRDLYDLWRLWSEKRDYLNFGDIFSLIPHKFGDKDFPAEWPDDWKGRVEKLRDDWESAISKVQAHPPHFTQVLDDFLILKETLQQKEKIFKEVLMSMNQHYAIRFKRTQMGDVEIEVEGDREFVDSKFEELWKRGMQPEPIPQIPTPQPAQAPTPSAEIPTIPPGERPQLTEFIRHHTTAKKHTELVLAITYYRWKFQNETITTYDDLREAYKVLMEKEPNFSETIRKLQAHGFVTKQKTQEGKPGWSLVQGGIKHFESKLLKRESTE